MTMMNTRFDTIVVPKLVLVAASGDGGSSAAAKRSPGLLVAASKNPLRVIVRNVSFAAEIYLSDDSAALSSNEPGSGTYQLPAGGVDTYMLAPYQALNAITLSDEIAKVCISVSEALPIDKL